MRIILLLPLLTAFSSYSQTGFFTDPRDGNVYSTITIGNKTWFRENLRLKTATSFFPNFSGDTSDIIKGNFYSMNELPQICPKGTHMATISEFKEYIRVFSSQNNIPDSSIIQTASDKDSSVLINLPKVLVFTDTLLRFEKTGWVEGNKRANKKSYNMWISDDLTNDNKFHVHLGALGYIIHTHLHNVIDKPKKIRKFCVRCVID